MHFTFPRQPKPTLLTCHTFTLQVALDILSRDDPPDWFLWLDCDALVTNHSISIEHLLKTYEIGEDVHFVVAEASGLWPGVPAPRKVIRQTTMAGLLNLCHLFPM